MKKGEVIAFPTDTVYALAAKLYDEEALAKIFTIKKRDDIKHIAVLCANIEQIREMALLTTRDEKIIINYMPGALTIILNSTPKHFALTNESTVGVRIPNHELAQALISEYGPVRATSVNDSGQEPLNDFETILYTYKGIIDKIFDTNLESSNQSSTVVDATDSKLKLVRAGSVKIT